MKGPEKADITLFGATGFVGKLTAEHLNRRCNEEGLVLALAGRRKEALDALAGELSSRTPAGNLGPGGPIVLVADSDDPDSLLKMARVSSVVASTVGPYATFGTPLVEACVTSGTDYCDLTGEVQWIRRTIDRFHKSARESGTRIVHSCGFDSIPSDLGVLLAQQRYREARGEPAQMLRMRLLRQAGGVSRGTLESMVELVKEATRDKGVRAVLKDPRSLEPGWRPPGHKGAAVPLRDPVSGEWTLPFLMEAVNGRIVRRSNAILGYPYGEDFRYHELVLLGSGVSGLLKAILGRLALLFLRPLIAFPPTRAIMRATLFPKPGEGPTIARHRGGHFSLALESPGLPEPLIQIDAERDPGYGATSIMLGEAAIFLAKSRAEASEGGVLTPATALGSRFAEQLTRQGVRFGQG